MPFLEFRNSFNQFKQHYSNIYTCQFILEKKKNEKIIRKREPVALLRTHGSQHKADNTEVGYRPTRLYTQLTSCVTAVTHITHDTHTE